MCSIGGIEQTVEVEEEKARWQRVLGVHVDQGLRIAVLIVQMLGVYLIQEEHGGCQLSTLWSLHVQKHCSRKPPVR